MPRPKGWKAHSYTTIVQICGRLILGHDRRAIERECAASPATVKHMAKILRDMGALKGLRSPHPTSEQDKQIWDLIRTTRLTNHQIRKLAGLTSSTAVRQRRLKFHADLRARGLPVPLCECGDEFQHVHRCSAMGLCPKPILENDRPDVVADLIAGDSVPTIAKRYDVARKRVERLLRRMSKTQRAKRLKAVNIRRKASVLRAIASTSSADLFARLDGVVPRGLPAEVRSETIQEMAFAIIDGQVAECDAVRRVKAFTGKAYRALGDPWRTVSIDTDHDGLSLADLIEDEGALGAFNELDDVVVA